MKSKKKIILSFIVVVIFLSASFLLTWRSIQTHKPENINKVRIGDTEVIVDIAITEEAQGLGLSFRPSLNENEGMLFVFDKLDRYPFWMKDMNFAIDMIWIGEDKKIIYIKKDARPELYPEIYAPSMEAKYVLEVVSGFSDKYNIKEGDKVKFVY